MALRWNMDVSRSQQSQQPMEIDQTITMDGIMKDIHRKSSILPRSNYTAGKKTITIQKRVKKKLFNVDLDCQLARDFSAMNLYMQGQKTKRNKKPNTIPLLKLLEHRTWSRTIEDLGLHLHLFKTDLSADNLEKVTDSLMQYMLRGNTYYNANKIHLYDAGGMVMRYLVKKIGQRVYSPGFMTTNFVFVVTDSKQQKKWSDILPRGIKCQIIDENTILEKFVKINDLIFYAINYRES